MTMSCPTCRETIQTQSVGDPSAPSLRAEAHGTCAARDFAILAQDRLDDLRATLERSIRVLAERLDSRESQPFDASYLQEVVSEMDHAVTTMWWGR